jgi:hypothetical protein
MNNKNNKNITNKDTQTFCSVYVYLFERKKGKSDQFKEKKNYLTS